METATAITAGWIRDVQWIDGWKSIRSEEPLVCPSIWLIDMHYSPGRWAAFGDRMLSSVETARANRFHLKEHRSRFEATHTLLRLLVGRLSGFEPASLRFGKGHHSKPILASPTGTDIHFNMSYTQGRTIVGLEKGHPIGVDIEWTKRPLDIDSMLEACFSSRERAYITAQPVGMLHRFFTLWTRKEAILKLTGEGIGEHLPYFEVLDGTSNTPKSIIGGRPPDHVYLYSFLIGEDAIGCLASEARLDRCAFFRV